MTSTTYANGTRVPYFEKVGTDVSGSPKIQDALQAADLDWQVALRPLAYAAKTSTGNATHRRVDGAFAIVREDTEDFMGTCSKRWTPVQNEEAFQFLDRLGDEGMTFPRAGSSRGGKLVWVVGTLPDTYELAGGLETERHLLFINHHNAGGALKIVQSPVVIACANAINATVRNAPRDWSAWHVGTPLEGKVQEARETLQITAKYTDELIALSQELAQVTLSDAQAEALARSLVPERPRSEKLVEGLLETYHESPYNPNTGNGFGFVNAVGEFYEWTKSTRSDEARFLGNTVGFIRRQRDTAVAAVKELAV